MNGRSTGPLVGEFIDRDGVLYANPSELRDLGFVVPQGHGSGHRADPAFCPSQCSRRGQRSPADAGRGRDRRGANPDGTRRRGFGPFGAACRPPDTARCSTTTSSAPSPACRTPAAGCSIFGCSALMACCRAPPLPTSRPRPDRRTLSASTNTYTYSEPDDLRQWLAGDVVTGAVSCESGGAPGRGSGGERFCPSPRPRHLSAAGDQLFYCRAFHRQCCGQRHSPVQCAGAARPPLSCRHCRLSPVPAK